MIRALIVDDEPLARERIATQIEDVDWFEADGNYVRLHAADTVFTVRSTLRRIEERLDPARVPVSRSYSAWVRELA